MFSKLKQTSILFKKNINSFSQIKNVRAREILDSRGNPTVEADVETDKGIFRAAVPSGASTGIYEAVELRDGNKNRYLGKGVLNAVNNVNTIINKALTGKHVEKQAELDKIMVEELDGTKGPYGYNKSKIGGNAILAVSLALARAGAASANLPLYHYLAHLAGRNPREFALPVPSLNVINGGKHAGNKLAMQEFMILPTGADSFRHALQMGSEVYQHLKIVINKKYGLDATNVGDEGGFAPNIQVTQDALDLLMEAISIAGYSGKIDIGMDMAASEFYIPESKLYDLDFKNPNSDGSQRIPASELIALYQKLCNDYPLISIEDPFDQDDLDAYEEMTKKMGSKIQIVGDDLLATNRERVILSEKRGLCNALLLKVNQIGSITEAIDAANLTTKINNGVMVSHRSGETEDTFISHLVVGLGVGQIKTGAPARSERTAKYNELLRIEEQLGNTGVYAGKKFRTAFLNIK